MNGFVTPARGSWFVPCNIKLFDVIQHFENNNQLTVKQLRNVSVGDYVYIYVGQPYSRILYRCVVEEAGIPIYDLSTEEQYAITKGARTTPYMRLQVDARYSGIGLTFHDLRENGMGSVQSQQSIPRRTVEYIKRIEQDKG